MNKLRRLGLILILGALGCLLCAAAQAETLVLPARLTVIDAEAFENAGALDEVMIPEGAKRIESLAFANSGVRRVYLPASLEYIAPDAFSGCEGMTAWGQYGSAAEEYCTEHGITFEAAMLDMNVFTVEFTSGTEATITGYTGTDEVLYLPGSVDETHKITRIGEGAFRYSKIKYIMLPPTLKRIEKNAFFNCRFLEMVQFNEGLQYIGESAFASCPMLTEANLPNSVTHILKGAFRYCTSLSYFHYPAFLAQVGEEVFYGCTKLTSVEITEGIMDFTPVFQKCAYLEELVLPDTITVIPEKAFLQCSALTTLRIHDGENILGNLGEITLPPNLTTISDRAFELCTSISMVVFNEKLSSIGSGAFLSCRSLGSALLPDSVSSIGAGAFNDCTELRAFHYPARLRSGGYNSAGILVYCPNLTFVEVPDGVAQLLAVFRGNTAIETVTLPESLTTMEQYSFYGCTGLKNVCVAGGRTHAEDECTVELPPLLTSVNAYCFHQCESITKLECNSKLTSINVGAFESCTGLREAVLNEGLITINQYAFRDCTALEKADIPSTVTNCHPEAFENCPLLP